MCVCVRVYRYIIYIFIIVFVLCRGMKIFAPTCRFVTDLILHFFAMYSYSIFKTLLFLKEIFNCMDMLKLKSFNSQNQDAECVCFTCISFFKRITR